MGATAINSLDQESAIAQFIKQQRAQFQGDLPHPLQLEDE
jgi:hypothetical protein